MFWKLGISCFLVKKWTSLRYLSFCYTHTLLITSTNKFVAYTLITSTDRFVKSILLSAYLIDLTDYSFLPNILVSTLTYFSQSSTDEGYIPIFSYTKLFLVDLRPNNKVVFSRTA